MVIDEFSWINPSYRIRICPVVSIQIGVLSAKSDLKVEVISIRITRVAYISYLVANCYDIARCY